MAMAGRFINEQRQYARSQTVQGFRVRARHPRQRGTFHWISGLCRRVPENRVILGYLGASGHEGTWQDAVPMRAASILR
jgi:hypothetical protein